MTGHIFTNQEDVDRYNKYLAMTEQEQAKEIIESFYPFVEGIDMGERHRAAIQCAIIHVKGIIETMTYDLKGNAIFPHHGTFKRWDSVLKHLEKK